MIHIWDVDATNVKQYDAPVALRWLNGHHVHDLYVQDTDMTEFLNKTGLRPQMHKGGFVLSKRLSRLMRPYFASAFFPRETVSIHYLEQDERAAKFWDGAGRVRRSLLLRVLEAMPELPPGKRAELTSELHTCRRIEFTLMGAGEWSEARQGGQDKGHCIVFEDDQLEADFVLPRDTKGEVLLADGSIFIGLYPIHHTDTMRLDIQSLINLWGFFRHDDLVRRLNEEGALFLQSVQNGDVARAMRRIDQTDPTDDDEVLETITNWHIREYLASGGDPLWFGAIVKGLINQHLKRIHSAALGRLRLPVPGGRYYVMTDRVGGIEIPGGHIKLDPASGTAWVNADDWADFAADVWGGADQDDALWIFPFTNHDGSQQVLAWRSPNQLGEYVLFRPTPDSHIPVWETVDDSLSFPQADSRQLPERSDRMRVNYLNLVDPDSAGGLGEWLPDYSIEAMSFTMGRASQNRGALGMYCNLLLLARALYNRLPTAPPAPLEAVIDGSVKTGTDLTPVKDWCYAASRQILGQGKAIPAALQDRLALSPDTDDMPATSQDHWFDQLIGAIEAHITHIETERDTLMARTMPPIELFNQAYASETILKQGARFNQIYTSRLPWNRTQRGVDRGMPIEEALELARQRSTDYLEAASAGDLDTQHLTLIAAAGYYYANPDHSGKDESLWQMGPYQPDGSRETGIAQQMIQALRRIGILNELSQLEDGRIVRYPGAQTYACPRRPVKIVGVWFNYWRFIAAQRGLVVPERMQQVADADEAWAKAEITQHASGKFRGMTLHIRREDGRALVYTQQGNRFGTIAKEHTDMVGDQMTLRFCIARDGNLLAVFK
jgi:hypothetical protein